MEDPIVALLMFNIYCFGFFFLGLGAMVVFFIYCFIWLILKNFVNDLKHIIDNRSYVNNLSSCKIKA